MTARTDYSSFLRLTSEGPARLELAIEGITSPQAIGEIEGALSSLPGLVHARLNLTTRRLTTEWSDRECDPSPAIMVLERLGYRVAPFTSDQGETEEDRYTRWLLRCLAVAGFAAINVMLLSVSIWAGNVTDITPETRDLFHWLSALIALPAAGFSGQPFFYKAARALRQGDMTMDVPISIGISLAIVMSVYETAHHAEEAYFDSALMLIFFLLCGRVLDHLMRRKTRAAAINLAALRMPIATRVESDGRWVDLPSEALAVGDVILVRPGGRIAADGIIISGTSKIDASLVTGETDLKTVSPGDLLYAGTLNHEGTLQIRVKAIGAATLLSEIERLVDDALVTKSRYVQLADKIARLYAPVVHIAAALTAMMWIALGAGVHQSLIIAIAVLIITCPCALALAAPVVQVVTAGALFRKGVIVRSADMIEVIAGVDLIVFDKTGTLTLPEPSLLSWGDLTDDQIRLAGQLAASSLHPLARAVRDAAIERLGPLQPLDDVEEVTGCGMRAVVSGQEARLGHPSFCQIEDTFVSGTDSIIGFRHGGEAALILIGQSLRKDAIQVIRKLREQGFRLQILSGDHDAAVHRVATTLEIDEWRADLTPAQKRACLETLKQAGHKVLMVGDGLNDAPALAAADASLAPATGADVAQASADALFTGQRLQAVRDLIGLARKGRRVMIENFVIALLYNLFAVPLAVMGYVTPLIAAAAMSGSSILVVVNALRARSIKDNAL